VEVVSLFHQLEYK